MSAYVKLQEAEFAAESRGYTATKHQREVGTGYFDEITQLCQGGQLVGDGADRFDRRRAVRLSAALLPQPGRCRAELPASMRSTASMAQRRRAAKRPRLEPLRLFGLQNARLPFRKAVCSMRCLRPSDS